jgi:hypothetical protein
VKGLVFRYPAIEQTAVCLQFLRPRNFLLQEIVNGEEEVSIAVALDIFFGRRSRLEPSTSQSSTSNDPSFIF